jgi:hypothetical protein
MSYILPQFDQLYVTFTSGDDSTRYSYFSDFAFYHVQLQGSGAFYFGRSQLIVWYSQYSFLRFQIFEKYDECHITNFADPKIWNQKTPGLVTYDS